MRSLRALLVVGLLAGFYVLAAALVVGLGWLAWFTSRDHVSVGTVFLLVLAGAVVVAVAKSLRGSPGLASSSSERPQDAFPALWTEISAAAAAAGTRPPDRVFVDLDVNAGVSERAKALGLLGGPRTLSIGLPVLAGMSVSQLRAVLAHEFGHFAGGDTRLGPVVYRGRQQLAQTIAGLGKHRVLRRVFLEYQSIYLVASQAVARRQERTADLVAAELTSPGTVVAMLRRNRALAKAWPAYVHMIDAAQGVGLRPVDIAGGFRLFLEDPVRAAEIAEIERADPPDPPPTGKRSVRAQAADLAKALYASHPTFQQRVAVLEALPDKEVVADDRPALALLGDATLDAGVRGFLSPRLRVAPARDWDDIAAALCEQRMKPVAERVAATARTVLGKPATVADVLDLIDAGRATELLHQDDQGEPADHLYAYLGCAGLGAGRLRPRIGWHGPFVRWIDEAGNPSELSMYLVADALAGRDSGRLRVAVRSWLSHGRPGDQTSPVR